MYVRLVTADVYELRKVLPDEYDLFVLVHKSHIIGELTAWLSA